jgi:hypothetical protein
MKAQINTLNTYFCYDAYSTAGRPKMEAELFNIAKDLVLYRTIPGENVDDLVGDLWHRQEVLLEIHKNWKATSIDYHGGQDGHFWLNIGESHLSFREIRGEY